MPKASKTTRALLFATMAVLGATLLLGRGDQDTTETIEYVDTWPESAEVVLLLDFADSLDDAERQAVLDELPRGFELNSIYSEEEGVYRIVLPRAQAIALDERWDGDERIEFLEPEYQYESYGAPNDPYYQFQWNLDQIGSESAWNRSAGRSIVVAVIDTGVAFADQQEGRFTKVKDLNLFVAGYDFVDDDEFPYDEHGHGTHVAGTVAQTTNNDYGVASVAPHVKIMPLRVLNRFGSGSNGDIADAVRFAADNGADVINMSLGGPYPSKILSDSIRYAHSRGVVVIAAAGNSGWSRRAYPAANEHVIAVAATQYDRTTTFYSNFGSYIDIAAPGGNTRVDQNGDGRPDGIMQETIVQQRPTEHEFALYMGTSMASPHVAGAAALVMGMGISDPNRVEEILLSSADSSVENYSTDRYGQGLLDVDAATSFPLVRYHLPRALLAFLCSLWLLGLSKERKSLQPVHKPILVGTAVLAASGLALVTFAASLLGVNASLLAPLSTHILSWPSLLGLDFLAHNALWLSAIPIVALYSLFGGVKGRKLSSLVVGLMIGLSIALVGEAMAPLQDVAWMPHAFTRFWLLGHGLLGLCVAGISLRKD